VANAHVVRLLFEGRRCVGAVYRRGEDLRTIHAGEVVLSAGAIGTPQILQASGVGPASHLRSLGIEVVRDAPGVGRNLMDHYAATVARRVAGTLTLNDLVGSWRLGPAVLQWLISASGPLTFGATTATVFCKSGPDVARPDIQILFLPGIYRPRSSGAAQLGRFEDYPGMKVSVSAARPKSRGSILIASADTREQPTIRPGYLSDPDDLRVLVSGVEIARRVFRARALAPFVGAEVLPGSETISDDEIADYARATGHSVSHPCGTCRMGTDSMAVVGPDLRVIGLDGLRIADASIMPSIPSGNINAACTMIGEKASALMLDRTNHPRAAVETRH
jgi:choline dehydrogenase